MKQTARFYLVFFMIWIPLGAAQVGVKAGWTTAGFHFPEAPRSSDWQYQTHMHIGASFHLPISDGVSLQPELLYNRKGARFKASYLGADLEIKHRLEYLELPILVKLDVLGGPSWALGIAAGGYGAVNIGAAALLDYMDESLREITSDEIRKTEFGAAWGIEVGWRRWSLGVRYAHGLTNIKEPGHGRSAVKNRCISTSLGFSIFRFTK